MNDHETGNTGSFLSRQSDNSCFPSERVKFYKGGMDVVRKLILDRLQQLDLGMAQVSLQIGKNEAYLQQFLKRGSPKELRERERALLAEILKVPEAELRGPSTPLPKRGYNKQDVVERESLIDVTSHTPQIAPAAQRSVIPGAELFSSMDLPVFGTAQGGDGALIITDRPVDYVARPSVLLRVEDGYGMIVTGDSMDPALRSGSTALVNPHLPPRVGDLCLFRSHAEDGSTHAAVKEYRGETETSWKVRQYTPAKDFTLRKSEWQDRPQRIVGSYFT
ncbi:S24 family peptidase [Bradyrhizobium sp. USDA 4452]